MTIKWYYVTSKKTHQEFSEEEVQGLLSNNTISADTLIWNTSMADWKPAAEVKPEWFVGAESTAAASPPSSSSEGAPPQDSPSPGTPAPPVAAAPPPAMGTSSGTTDPMAMASMVSGIIAIVVVLVGCFIFLPCGAIVGVAIAIPAVVTGHIALKNIKLGIAGPEGRGMAIAGLIMGYATIALLVLVILIGVLGIGFSALAERGGPFQ